jgi:HAE1 family hydrophobic/amphiphilic exporter-1
MATSTLLAVFFVPVFYVVMQRLSEWRRPIVRQNASDERDADSRAPSDAGNADTPVPSIAGNSR